MINGEIRKYFFMYKSINMVLQCANVLNISSLRGLQIKRQWDLGLFSLPNRDKLDGSKSS